MKVPQWQTGMLAAVMIAGLALAAAAAEVKVKYENVPPGTTITYVKDGVSVTEPLVAGKEYPPSGVVTLGEKGSIKVTVVGSTSSATLQGDKGASFDLSGSTSVGGVVVNVPAGGSNIRMKVGDGSWSTIAAGGSSAGGGSGTGGGGGGGGSGVGGGNDTKNPLSWLQHGKDDKKPAGGTGGSSSGSTYR